MLAQQAVELQKAGMSFTEIGNHCGVTANQVSRWLQYMGYDAATYHLPAIIEAIEAGTPFYRALQQCGLTTGGTQKLRVATMLAERGIHLSRVSAVTIKREPDTRARCLRCQILLEPYDPPTSSSSTGRTAPATASTAPAARAASMAGVDG